MHCDQTLVSVALHYRTAVLQEPAWTRCRQVASTLASRCTFATCPIIQLKQCICTYTILLSTCLHFFHDLVGFEEFIYHQGTE